MVRDSKRYHYCGEAGWSCVLGCLGEIGQIRDKNGILKCPE